MTRFSSRRGRPGHHTPTGSTAPPSGGEIERVIHIARASAGHRCRSPRGLHPRPQAGGGRGRSARTRDTSRVVEHEEARIICRRRQAHRRRRRPHHHGPLRWAVVICASTVEHFAAGDQRQRHDDVEIASTCSRPRRLSKSSRRSADLRCPAPLDHRRRGCRRNLLAWPRRPCCTASSASAAEQRRDGKAATSPLPFQRRRRRCRPAARDGLQRPACALPGRQRQFRPHAP